MASLQSCASIVLVLGRSERLFEDDDEDD
jgi:hypothetical protein